jgi:copper chaperone CopZ
MPWLKYSQGDITMQTALLKVTGMTCGGCTNKVTSALKAIDGVDDVKVSLTAGEATVQYDERRTSPDQLKSAVQGAGYAVDLTGAGRGQKPKGGCYG